MEHYSMERFCGGGMSEQFNRALAEVFQNIVDPNTEAEKPRKITIAVTLKPTANRNMTQVSVQTKTTLVPAEACSTSMAVGKDLKTGRIEAVEIGDNIPGQLTMEDHDGELKITEASNIIDMRR